MNAIEKGDTDAIEDLLEDELFPEYKILATEEIEELKSWFIDPDSLPKIFENDPQL